MARSTREKTVKVDIETQRGPLLPGQFPQPQPVQLAKVELSPETTRSSAALIARITALLIRDRTGADLAGAMLKELKALIDGIEAKRKEFVEPLNQHVKKINAEFRRYSAPLEEANRQLRAKVVQYQQEERERAEQAQKEAEERARKMEEQRQKALAAKSPKARAQAEASLAKVEIEATEATQRYLDAAPRAIDGVAGVNRWDFVVVDAGVVPREYLEVDAVKVRKAIHAGAREIPGLRIFQKAGLAVGRG